MFKETKNMGKIKTFSKEAFSPEGLDDPSLADAFATEWDIEGLDSYIVSKQIIDDEYVVKIESAFEIIWFGFKTIEYCTETFREAAWKISCKWFA